MLCLAGCGGTATGDLMGQGARVDVEGDTFYITREGNRAEARNFATGLFNQDRLFTHAQTAIAGHTGCEITHFEQETGVNAYRARLACA